MNTTIASRILFILIIALSMLTPVSCKQRSSDLPEGPINIGVDLPISVLPDLSASIQNGLMMAATEINDRGGINGRPINLVIYDDAFSMSIAVNNVARLIQDDEVVAVIGPADTDSIKATLPLFERNQVVQIIVTGAPELVDAQQHPYLFRMGPTDSDQTIILINYALEHCQDIAVVTDDTIYGEQGLVLLKDELNKHGKQPLVVERFSYGDVDMTAQVESVIDSGADGVILWGVGDEPGYVTKALRAKGWQGKIIGGTGLSLLSYREIAGQEAIQGVVFVSLGARGWAMDRRARPYVFDQQRHVSFDSEKWTEWQDRYWSLFGEEYFWWGADPQAKGHSVTLDDALVSPTIEFFSYSALYVLKEAMEKASGATSGEEIQSALESISVSGIWHHDFQFSPDCHEGLTAKDLVLLEYKDDFVEPVPLSEYEGE